jgi:phosphate transport system permease protein
MATPLDTANAKSSAGSAASASASQSQAFNITKRVRPVDGIVRVILFFCAIASVGTTVGIVLVFGAEAVHFFTTPGVTLFGFLTGTVWQPQTGQFGILPLLGATLMTSFWAMTVAIPLGLGAAIYLSEYASKQTRDTMKPVLEMLAGIPSVVYGFFALTFMTPIVRSIFGYNTVEVYNTFSAGLVMGIMILPTIASMSEDALNAVPRSLREASYGLGATKFETIVKVIIPAALSGLLAAFLLGISRAVGETMIVAIAAGSRSNLTLNPFVAAETITGHIARISGGDLSYDSIDYTSLFALGLALFVFTLVLNLLSQYVSRRFREAY